MSLLGLPSHEVRVRGVELRWLDLHLRSPHVSALGAETERPVVVARIATEGPSGWGECAALVAPTYSEEYTEGAWSVLGEYLVPILLEAARSYAGRLPASGEVSGLLGTVRGHSMAKACLEMAVIDAGLRAESRSLADALGVGRDRVEAGAVVAMVGSGGATEAVLREVEDLVTRGYSRVKVKIAPGADLGPLRALRRAFPHLGILADANGSYRLGEPAHTQALQALDDLDLLCVEQPLQPDDLAGHAQLCARLETPVCLDESVWSLGRLREAIEVQACDMVCIKASRLGGLLEAVAAHDICTDSNIPVWCGGMLETSLARSANAALAALPGFVLPGDLEGGERFVEADPFLAGAGPEVARYAEPIVHLYPGPGVGPEPDPEAIDRVTTRSHWAPI